MNSEQDMRLYEMEVTPPAEVWSNLSVLLDEINDDNRAAAKILNIAITPSKNVWENINASFDIKNIIEPQKKSIVFSIKKIAVAAVAIGFIVTVWIFINNRKENTQIASAPEVKQNFSAPNQTPDTMLKLNAVEKIIPETIT